MMKGPDRQDGKAGKRTGKAQGSKRIVRPFGAHVRDVPGPQKLGGPQGRNDQQDHDTQPERLQQQV